jgi:alpha-galactosidase
LKFPSTLAWISKYIHQKGLKFGLYSGSGYKTCTGKPGSYGYEKIDAIKFAKW